MKFLKVEGIDDEDFGCLTFLENFEDDWDDLYGEVYSNIDHEMDYAIDQTEDGEPGEEFLLTAFELDCSEEAFEKLYTENKDYDESKSWDIFPIGEWEK